MADFFVTGNDWHCPRCSRHIILDAADIDDHYYNFRLVHADPQWYQSRFQTVACRVCRHIVATFGFYRVQMQDSNTPQRRPERMDVMVTNGSYRELVVYPLHVQQTFDETVVPDGIVRDYEEAAAIVDLSPRASAVLSRRCLQAIMRGYYKVGNLRTLHDEIEAAHANGMPTPIFEAAMALKTVGNIGAHPEQDIEHIVDIEPHEASALVAFVAFLFENTYIKDVQEQARLAKIAQLGKDKSSERKQ